MKILLLEDDIGFGSSLEDFLSESGYHVVWTQDGEKAYEIAYETNFDLFLFDINVPSISGLNLLAEIRKLGNNTPTIFITSFKDLKTVKQAFANGCDDYLKKPFDIDELLLRIEALAKRIGICNDISFPNGYQFNTSEQQVLLNGKPFHLTTKELELFNLLLKHKNRIVLKNQIINALWAYDEEYSDGSLRVYINKIKKIVGNDALVNIKGQGYKLII